MKIYTIVLVQVLSESVAKGIVMIFGEEAAETTKFVSKYVHNCLLKVVQRVFCFNYLNVHNCTSGKTPFQGPYRSSGDFRLKMLVISSL